MAVGIVLILLLGGCGSSSSTSSSAITSWQRGVEQYLATKNNDPQSLRDVTLEDSRRGFAVLGGEDPRKATDERALLLAHKTIGERPWFIYLVGVVKNEQVQELRLVTLSVAGGQTTWRVGPRDAQAFKQYRDAGWSEWKQHATAGGGVDANKPPPQYTSFPRASDVFEVTIDGSVIRAQHAASSAVFTVDTAQTAATKGTKAAKTAKSDNKSKTGR
jgi:hypothetical protein